MSIGRISLFGILCTMIVIQSCVPKECKDGFKEVGYPADSYTYFGVYRPGSWWVYEERSGLRDSVFVSDFKQTLINSSAYEPCERVPVRSMQLHSDHLSFVGTPLDLEYQMSWAATIFDIGGQGQVVIPRNGSFSDIRNSRAVGDTLINSVSYSNVLSVILQPPPSQGVNSWLVAEGYGIIQYYSATDTFTLEQSHFE